MVLEPAYEVGGDLVDCFPVADRLVLVLGDVSHKGAGAALFMARTHSLIRGLAARPDAESLFGAPARGAAPGQCRARFQQRHVHVRDVVSSPPSMCNPAVSTMSAPAISRRGCAGHPRTLERLDVMGGPPLGLVEDMTYREGSIALGPGDRLLAVTDGITEAADPSDAQFGEARLEDFLAAVGPQDADVLTHLTAAVRAFEAGRPAFDDVAAMLVTIGPE